MAFLLDSANLADIQRYQEIFPIEGVTTNPSILKKVGKVDTYTHLREIRKIIGPEKTLHVQVVGTDADTMLEEADCILKEIDATVFIKVPVTTEGLKVIKTLKNRGVGVTATAIYSKMQAFLAIEAGADYIAPYYNRMENLNSDMTDTMTAIVEYIRDRKVVTKILGASYKNIAQVNHTLTLGGHCVTVNPELLWNAVETPAVQKAVVDFQSDWESVYGGGANMLLK
ncbi:fructose-6-phosphate aldolase [Streptococcus gallinaceus]|uniref:TalC/MipB family fructose-6-phosphate aldolase n=1 Tax=Streptococcus gallinaceus TaxID=165758 RepID=A0ABV2JM70_9STRE